MVEDRTVLGLVLLFGLFVFWSLLVFAASRLSGWNQLAQSYRESAAFDGEQWRFQRVAMRHGVGYNGMLTVGVNDLGTCGRFRCSYLREI